MLAVLRSSFAYQISRHWPCGPRTIRSRSILRITLKPRRENRRSGVISAYRIAGHQRTMGQLMPKLMREGLLESQPMTGSIGSKGPWCRLDRGSGRASVRIVKLNWPLASAMAGLPACQSTESLVLS
jgi:hypothetical protein